MDCIFCKIAQKKIKVEPVLETDRVIVINDAHPQAPTHLLVLPKTHYSTLLDCNDKTLLADMMEAAVTAAKKLGKDERGFRLAINTNEEGGQTVFHLHIHLLAGRPLNGALG